MSVCVCMHACVCTLYLLFSTSTANVLYQATLVLSSRQSYHDWSPTSLDPFSSLGDSVIYPKFVSSTNIY